VRKREGHNMAFSPPHLPALISIFCPPSLTPPLVPDVLLLLSPSLPSFYIFFSAPPISPYVLSVTLFSSLASPLPLRLSNAVEVNTTRLQVNTPSLFLFPQPTACRGGERRCINTAITACLSTGGGDGGGRGRGVFFPSLSYSFIHFI